MPMNIQERVSLKDKTTLHSGGQARYFANVGSTEELAEAIQFSEAQNIPFFILGGGSNVLFSDAGFNGLVIHIGIQGIEWSKYGAKVCAGENWDNFVRESIRHEMWGVENLSGIPGTVGAAPIQNIGAYGVEVKERIMEVEVFNTNTKQNEILRNADCQFSYRDSLFKKPEGKRLVVTSVTFLLSKIPKPNLGYKDIQAYFKADSLEPTLQNIRSAVLDIRSGKFPDLQHMATAGSFFKNPIISEEHYKNLSILYPDIPSYAVSDKMVKVPLAWILDKVCQLKGFRNGNVWLHDSQPLVLVTNRKAASTKIFVYPREGHKAQ